MSSRRFRRRIRTIILSLAIAAPIFAVAGLLAFQQGEAVAFGPCGADIPQPRTKPGALEGRAGDGHPARGPADPLARLLEGNRRFQASRMDHPNQETERRSGISQGQEPFAIVLSCSDSRVPPEVIFDQGLGDIFVVRIAGNSVDPAVLGSIEYAAEHLKASLVVVLGHERCGAVKAAAAGGEAPGHLAAVLEPIGPAVASARAKGGDLAEEAMRTHVRNVAERLRSSKPVIAELVHEGKLRVVGARYDLDTGAVEVLEK